MEGNPVNINSNSRGHPTSFLVKTELLSDSKMVAETFNNYFSSITSEGKMYHFGKDFPTCLKNSEWSEFLGMFQWKLMERNFTCIPLSKTSYIFSSALILLLKYSWYYTPPPPPPHASPINLWFHNRFKYWIRDILRNKPKIIIIFLFHIDMNNTTLQQEPH